MRVTLTIPGYVEATDFFFGPNVSTVSQSFQAGWNSYASAPSGLWTILYGSMFLKYYFLGLPASLSEKLGLAEGYFLSGVFMYAGMRLSLTRTKPELAYYGGCTIASVFYLVNRLAITSIHFFAYGYAALPLVMGSYIMTTRDGRNVLFHCFVVALGLTLAFSHATFLATSILLVVVYQLYRFINSRREAFQDIRKFGIILILFVALNSYWILPMLVPYLGGSTTIVGHGELRTVSYDDFLNLGAKPITSILALNNHWLGIYTRDFLPGLWTLALALIAIPLSRALKFEHRNIVTFFGIAFSLSFLLAIRDQPIADLIFSFYNVLPFTGLTWAFLRNPQWFFYVIAYCLAFSAGVTALLVFSKILMPGTTGQVGAIFTHIPNGISAARKKRKAVLPLLVVFLIGLGLLAPLVIYTGYPLSGNLKGRFEPIQFPTAYQHVVDFLNRQQGSFRVWWLPVSVEGNFEFDWQATETFTFPTPYLSNQPYLDGSSKQSDKFLVDLYGQEILGNMTHGLGKVLAPLGVRFIVVHEDLRKDQTSLYLPGNPYSNSELKTLEKVLERQSDLHLVFHEDFYSTNIFNQTRPSKMLVFENSLPIPYVFASSPLILVGGVRSMIDLIETPQFNPFDRSAILSEQLGTPELRNLLMKTDTVVFGQNQATKDLALQLEDTRFNYPAQYTTRTKPDQFWSVLSDDQLFFYVRQFSQKLLEPYVLEGDFLYGGVAAGTSARNAQLGYGISLESTGSYDVWLRSVRSPIGGNFSLLLDDHPLNIFQTLDNLTYMSWEKAGTVILNKGEHHLVLDNLEGSNLVNVVAVTPSSELEGTQNWVARQLKTKNTFTLMRNESATVLWDSIINAPAAKSALRIDKSPAEILSISMRGAGEYNVVVQADRPYFLTFSEVFNSGWNTVGVSSILAPSFGLLNGFYLDTVGSYRITMKYAFNSYYQVGVWPTIGTLVGIPVVLIRKKLAEKVRVMNRTISSSFSDLWN
jgi:hypothetical protein